MSENMRKWHLYTSKSHFLLQLHSYFMKIIKKKLLKKYTKTLLASSS